MLRKPYVKIIFFFVTVAIFATLVLLHEKKGRFEDYDVSTDEYEAIKSCRVLTDDLLISDFSLNGYVLPLSSRNSEIPNADEVVEYPLEEEKSKEFPEGASGIRGDVFLYPMPESEKTGYNPIVEYHGEVQMALEEAYITDERIGRSHEYRMMAYNDEQYHEFSLYVTTLPVIEIEYNSKITKWESSDAVVTVHDNRDDALTPLVKSDATIRLRGGSTIDYPKRPFRISMKDESVGGHNRKNRSSILGMRQDEDWILYPAYNDREKVRNVFCSNLWMKTNANRNDFGVENGYEYRYCELLINGEYRGLYAIGQPMDARQLALNTDDTTQPIEYLYKKTDWYDEREYLSEEYEKETDGSDNSLGASGYSLVSLKNGVEESEEDWAVLKGYWSDMFGTYDAEELRRHTDMKSAMDLYLLFNMIQGDDSTGGRESKNWYLSFKCDGDHYVAIYTPWDMDISWGNGYNGSSKNRTNDYGIEPDEDYIMENNPVHVLMEMGDPDISTEITDEYNELRTKGWDDGTIDEMIDDFTSKIFDSGAYKRDRERWPNGSYLEDDGMKLEIFREYVHERMNCVDEHFPVY